MIRQFLKKEYSELIKMTTFRDPNYEVIEFGAFVRRFLNDPDAFSEQIFVAVKQQFTELKWNEKTCFREYGQLSDVPYRFLHYYQPEVGINGPWHTSLEEPVNMVRFDGKTILWNGYHRSLVRMLTGYESATGYLVMLD